MKKKIKNIYHIIITSRGKQMKDVYWTDSEIKVNDKLKEIKAESDKVIFPTKYISKNKEGILDAEYEAVIIKKRDKYDDKITKLRDNYGEFINYESSSDDWVIYDRIPIEREETFYVYGYHPLTQRKTFQWIFDEYIAKDADDKYKFRTVIKFKNKLVIDKAGELNIVLCKNESDCIRMYNQIQRMADEKKFKYIIFGGDVIHTSMKSKWYSRLKEWTGWSMKKLSRKSLRP